MQPYEEAQKIDEQIADLMVQFPVEKNRKAWALFCRTIRSTLDIVEDVSVNFQPDAK